MALFEMSDLLEGSIKVDGQSLSSLPLQVIRSRLALIPQEPLLFSGTVRSEWGAGTGQGRSLVREAASEGRAGQGRAGQQNEGISDQGGSVAGQSRAVASEGRRGQVNVGLCRAYGEGQLILYSRYRSNLDPKGQMTDAEMWEKLEMVQLKDFIAGFGRGLGT